MSWLVDVCRERLRYLRKHDAPPGPICTGPRAVLARTYRERTAWLWSDCLETASERLLLLQQSQPILQPGTQSVPRMRPQTQATQKRGPQLLAKESVQRAESSSTQKHTQATASPIRSRLRAAAASVRLAGAATRWRHWSTPSWLRRLVQAAFLHAAIAGTPHATYAT